MQSDISTMATAQHDQHPRGEFIRAIGTGFGSLAGACLLFLSVLANLTAHDITATVAIACFAVALPLLAFTTVAAYSLSWLDGASAHSYVRQAMGATVAFGLFGAAGVVGGITALLWRIEHFAGGGFAACAVLALVVYLIFARRVAMHAKRAIAAKAL